MRSFICGPNEAPGRSLVVWSFTCGPNETPSRSLVMWPWVFVLWFYAFEIYWKIIWLTWCIMLFQYSYLEKLGVALFFLNISDYCKEDDFERICIKVSKYTLCFVTCFSINKLVFPLIPLFIYLLGFSSFLSIMIFTE